jgi:GNAT superfamily N-acetyltransferase
MTHALIETMQPAGATSDFRLADVALARQLEATEGLTNAAFVEARASLESASGAGWIRVAGVWAMFDAPGSPLTQTFGLGVFDSITDHDLDTLEGFFRDRGAPVFHEATPMISADLLRKLNHRGYHPVEFSNVLFRPVEAAPSDATGLRVRHVASDRIDHWAAISGAGWSTESPEIATFVEELGRIMGRAAGVHCFLAEENGSDVAAAALSLQGDVALLAGASTVPHARNRGAQRALSQARLRFAAEHGASLAMVVAQPGSSSQRNAERSGFRVAYTRTKWMLEGTQP